MDQDNESKPAGSSYTTHNAEISPTKPKPPCALCRLLNRLECTHLTAEECAELKPSRVLRSAYYKIIQVYECGHLYHGVRRVPRGTDGTRKSQKGMCPRCWNLLVWDGREVRIGKPEGGVRAVRRGKKAQVAEMPPKIAKGVIRKWVRRGMMIGQAEASGKRSKLF